MCKFRMETLEVESVFEATMFSEVFGTQPQGRIEVCAREGILMLWLWYVQAPLFAICPRKVSAACAMLLRRKGTICCSITGWSFGHKCDQLWLVLFNTRVQNCHKRFGCAHIDIASCLILARIKIWQCSDDSRNRQIKVPTKISPIQYIHSLQTWYNYSCITLCGRIKETTCTLRKQDPTLPENRALNRCEECLTHCTWQ